MNSSPGHKKWPEHKVLEEHPDAHVQVIYNGETVADSTNVIRVREDGHPPRYYIPREDIHMNTLKRTNHTTECPFKGTAHYFTINVRGKKTPAVAWSYEQPYDEHKALAGRIAFYEDKVDGIHVDEKKAEVA